MNLFSHIKALLEQNEKFCKDGNILKNIIVESALKLETELISLIINDEIAKKHFTQTIDDVIVFDKIKFQKFITNKQFLPDSYTAFKNKIGLTANEDYITDSKDVVLSWAYKDCVLEGGQTKEDQKRKEIFWNETLAPDEIDRLFEPKVLTKWKKYDKEGKHDLKEIRINDNLIIKGNNLLALHTIKRAYKQKIKLIYIDPPFNTGNDSFLYNDNFNHSTWLTFMKNRLEIAKELLRDDGFIFINIDDIEEAYLKIVCDEIFGRNNFLNVIAVKSSTPSGTKTAHKEKTIIKQKDLILVYRKSSVAKLNPQYAVREKWDKHYSLILKKKNNKYVLTKLIDELIRDGVISQKIGLDKLNVNDPEFKKYYLKNSDKICRLQSHKNKEADKLSREKGEIIYEHFKDGKSTGLYYNGQVVTPLVQGIHKVYNNKKLTNDLGMLLCDFWWDIDYQNTQNEGGVSFPTAKKPELLLSRIIDMATNENDIVLDYHLGSGTTAAVALKSNRQFIGVEQMDYGKNDSVQRLQNVINGENSGVSKAHNWNGGGSFIYAELAKNNALYIEKIEVAKNTDNLLQIWNDLKQEHFISYQVSISEIDSNINDFKGLTFIKQQQLLIALLDKNNLYVNFNDINDNTFNISAEDKSINSKFFRL
jgi:adenine-specific DNA-methyltransferase